LPPQIKGAVHSLAGLTWFAEEFSLAVDLEVVDADTIKATIKLRILLKNITNTTHPIKSFIHVDEWGHKRSSEILDCEVRTREATSLAKLNRDGIAAIGSSKRGETNEVRVAGGDIVELLASAVEYKHANDDLHYSLGYAATNPEIYITPLAGFEISAGISTYSPQQKHPHLNRYRLNGFYFPHQRMLVRWYPTSGAPDPRPRYLG
jgi:hypothetical protein